MEQYHHKPTKMVQMIGMATTASTNESNMRSMTSSTSIYATHQKSSHDVKSNSTDKATTWQ
eukprot:6469456-Amphidinium_carterae.2